jgi:hypothetical protein
MKVADTGCRAGHPYQVNRNDGGVGQVQQRIVCAPSLSASAIGIRRFGVTNIGNSIVMRTTSSSMRKIPPQLQRINTTI